MGARNPVVTDRAVPVVALAIVVGALTIDLWDGTNGAAHGDSPLILPGSIAHTILYGRERVIFKHPV